MCLVCREHNAKSRDTACRVRNKICKIESLKHKKQMNNNLPQRKTPRANWI